mmetsp:Transcript_95939/g.219928  ORF Transcript_95939/g.219928 Transcript_95939/m.219928 type:complete len:200 (-) Transcript_95939:507-1106(-)
MLPVLGADPPALVLPGGTLLPLAVGASPGNEYDPDPFPSPGATGCPELDPMLYEPLLPTYGWAKNCSHRRRCSGFFMRITLRSSSHCGEVRMSVPRRKDSKSILSQVSIFRSSSNEFRPGNGGFPNNDSKKIAPTDHMSTRLSYCSLRRISGAMYSGDPQMVAAMSDAARARAKPKSAIFSTASGPSEDSSRLCGFRSL